VQGAALVQKAFMTSHSASEIFGVSDNTINSLRGLYLYV
jgi:hypothetical protein